MDPERKNLLSIIRTREKRKEWKSKNNLLEQWFHINGEMIFHSCFKCVYKALQNSVYRKKLLFLQILRKRCQSIKFWSKSCLENVNLCFDKIEQVSSVSFCYACQYRLCFYIINNYFNSIDKSFIVKWYKICCTLVSFCLLNIFPALVQKKNLWII